MAKKTLKIDFDFDFILYGIVTTEKSHRLCWLLGKELGFNFNRTEDLELIKQGKIIPFAKFKDNNIDSDNEETSYLVSNKNSGYFIIPERKETDFLLLIRNFNNEGLVNKIKNINNIQSVFAIDPLTLQSKENLIF